MFPIASGESRTLMRYLAVPAFPYFGKRTLLNNRDATVPSAKSIHATPDILTSGSMPNIKSGLFAIDILPYAFPDDRPHNDNAYHHYYK